ncbi:MAG: methionyl-tRNA formyltransferase [Candidatus Omnitrophota bacterium]|jgi:methionyl-tRNA formyltransferase
MKLKTTFIGNESPFLITVMSNSDLHLIVCAPLDKKSKASFGGAWDFAKNNRIKTVTPDKYLKHPVPTDLIIVSGYHKLIPRRIILMPRIGMINIHQSLLPAYRGRHPLNWAIINGLKYTGVTIHHVSERFDAGNIILQKKVRIGKDDEIMDLYAKTLKPAKQLLAKIFRITNKRSFKGRAQNKRLASYFPARKPSDGKINWKDPAVNIRNLARALTGPYPGAYFYLKGKRIILEKAELVKKYPYKINAGEFINVNGSIIAGTGKGALKIIKIRGKAIKSLARLIKK